MTILYQLSAKKYVHSVSGAVGAICRHSSVRFVIASREDEGRYLNMSSILCPPIVRILTCQAPRFSELDAAPRVDEIAHLLSPTLIHPGFVKLSRPSRLPPIITLGNACCGSVAPAGSAAPGTMDMGKEEPIMSVRI